MNRYMDFNAWELIKKLLLNKEDVVNNLTSTDIEKPLSANMGKELNSNKLSLSIFKQRTQYEPILVYDLSPEPLKLKPGEIGEYYSYNARVKIQALAPHQNGCVRRYSLVIKYSDNNTPSANKTLVSIGTNKSTIIKEYNLPIVWGSPDMSSQIIILDKNFDLDLFGNDHMYIKYSNILTWSVTIHGLYLYVYNELV